jgi:hypothetical protein
MQSVPITTDVVGSTPTQAEEYNIMLLSFVGFMVFNATFNNISVISWRSVLLVEKTGGARQNHQPAEVTDKLNNIMLYSSA